MVGSATDSTPEQRLDVAIFRYIQYISGIKDANVVLALLLTASMLLSSYLLFQISSVIFNRKQKKSNLESSASDRDVLEVIYKENGGSSWLPEFKKNWMSKDAWETWKIDLTRNPFLTNPAGKWAGIEIDVIYGKDHVLEIQMRDNVNFTGMQLITL